ncbi:MAG TPA: hypothetical protein VNA22_07740 [Pyrinomonadaceae bacterium]|nr:hypothetical protein [Pyrinomonadaceae bacterium]
MNFPHRRSSFSRLLTLISAFALLTTQTMFVFAASDSRAVAGEITVRGTARTGEKPFVLVNGDRAFSGRTFFSGGTITTESSSATVDFGKLGRLEIGPGSTLNLSIYANKISGTLSSGRLNVAYAVGVAVSITTPDDVVTSEHQNGGSFAVAITAAGANVAAEKGMVRYNNGQTVAGTQDDDDDHDHNDWTWIAIVAGGVAAGALILYMALRDDDDVVSPVR